MDTPIFDFVQNYIKSNTARLHMPGHKGVSFLGCESADITEIKGADELYAPDGIIRKSEENATLLFDTAKTKADESPFAAAFSKALRSLRCGWFYLHPVSPPS